MINYPVPKKLSEIPQTHRNDYILWYKIQKFKKCVRVLGYALLPSTYILFNRPCNVKKLVDLNAFSCSP